MPLSALRLPDTDIHAQVSPKNRPVRSTVRPCQPSRKKARVSASTIVLCTRRTLIHASPCCVALRTHPLLLRQSASRAASCVLGCNQVISFKRLSFPLTAQLFTYIHTCNSTTYFSFLAIFAPRQRPGSSLIFFSTGIKQPTTARVATIMEGGRFGPRKLSRARLVVSFHENTGQQHAGGKHPFPFFTGRGSLRAIVLLVGSSYDRPT